MTKQAELDAIYAKLSRDYGKLNDKQVARGIKEVGRVRGDIAELLSEFAGSDGTVKRQRLSRLLRELDTVEKALRENGTIALEKTIAESTDFAIGGLNKGTSSVIGLPMVSANIEKLNKQTVDYVIRRFGEDGLVLSDRIWSTSGEIRDSIASVLRSGIIRGDDVGSMVRDVRKAYDAETWKIKRLVVTEGNTAYRVASANSVRDSEVADYVKINENGHRHGNHANHKCYKLAKVDKYSQGNGIYKPTDTEIYMPHPSCSSYVTPVILDMYLTGDFGGSDSKIANNGEEDVTPKEFKFVPAKDVSEVQNRIISTLGSDTVNFGKMPISLANDYLEGIEMFANDFPEIKGFIKTIDTKAKATEFGVFKIHRKAETIDGVERIVFDNSMSLKNPKDMAKFHEDHARGIKTNFSYAGSNAKTTAYHELVHALDYLVGMTENGLYKNGKFVSIAPDGKSLFSHANSQANQVIESAKKELYGRTIGRVVYDGTSYLGKYSMTNPQEALAQAISFLATGETEPYSLKVKEIFRKRVKEVMK